MCKRCLVCGKEWVEGELRDGLISHGVRPGYCTSMLELWTYDPKGYDLEGFLQVQTGKEQR